MTKSTKSFTSPEALADTSGFFAALVRGDPKHARASALLRRAGQSSRRFVTTDYILDETATLLMARGHGHLVESFFETVFASAACRVEWMDPDRFAATRQFFVKHFDQGWSFTDCFSFGIMRELGLHDALTTDGHFRHAGFNALLE
jgi:predicted nucleic acid-binding protein